MDREEIIKNYQNAVDEEIVNFVQDVIAGREVLPITVGFVSENMARRIRELTEIETEGNRIVLGADDVRHIIKRHGPEGSADHSMKDVNDIARLSYVLANYDSIEWDGRVSAQYQTSDRKGAPQVIISKRVNGIYYIVKVISDAKKKRNYVASVYLQKARE